MGLRITVFPPTWVIPLRLQFYLNIEEGWVLGLGNISWKANVMGQKKRVNTILTHSKVIWLGHILWAIKMLCSSAIQFGWGGSGACGELSFSLRDVMPTTWAWATWSSKKPSGLSETQRGETWSVTAGPEKAAGLGFRDQARGFSRMLVSWFSTLLSQSDPSH